jgi:hypothetical protein
MPNSSNLLLASLSASDAASLHPHLKSIFLEHEKVLFEAGDEIAAIYFPTGAIVSAFHQESLSKRQWSAGTEWSAHLRLLAEAFRVIEELSNSPDPR